MNIWSVYAHSVTGSRHQREGKANQDRYRFWTERNRPVLVLGDGAGSADKAGEGAEIAVTAAGSDIVAFCCGRADAQLRSVDMNGAEKLLQPEFANAFDRVNRGIKRSAAATKEAATSYSVSLTVAVLERQWVGCMTEGDVAVVSGRPGHWRLVNKIFKAEDRRPGSRNATNLLPYRTADGSSQTDFAPRQPGDLTLMFCDGALKAFLIDTTPTASIGSYVPNDATLDEFYRQFTSSVKAERVRTRSHSWRIVRALHAAWSALFPPPQHTSPKELLATLIDDIVRAGEQDDITVMAAID